MINQSILAVLNSLIGAQGGKGLAQLEGTAVDPSVQRTQTPINITNETIKPTATTPMPKPLQNNPNYETTINSNGVWFYRPKGANVPWTQWKY